MQKESQIINLKCYLGEILLSKIMQCTLDIEIIVFLTEDTMEHKASKGVSSKD